jgi:hypothetical protein
MFWRPVYRAKRVKTVRHKLRIAMVLVKAVLSPLG